MGVVIKNQYVNFDETSHFEEPPLRAEEHVVKRYKIKYTVPQMVRFGMLPYSALEEYEREQAIANGTLVEEQTEAAAPETAAGETAAEATTEEAPKKRGTFWEEDDGERELMSQADFEKFLKESGIDISNATSIF